MEKDCNIVRDLIPLYAEDLTSEESGDFVTEHCRNCEECRNLLDLALDPIECEMDKQNDRMKIIWKNIEKMEKKKKRKKILVSIVLITLCAFIVFGANIILGFYKTYDIIANDFNIGIPNCTEEYFGKEIYSELGEWCSAEDKAALIPLMEEIDEALHFIGTKEEATEKFGELSRYAIDSYSYEDAVSVEASVEFLTGKLYHDTGYMWIKYTQMAFDKNGENLCGGVDIESRITLIKSGKYSDEWIPIDIDEAP